MAMSEHPQAGTPGSLGAARVPTGAPPAAPHAAVGPLAMRVDFAYALGSRLLVYGWVLGLSEHAASALLWVGNVAVDLLRDAVRVKRPDVSKSFRDQQPVADDHGFLALITLTEAPTPGQTLRLTVHLNSGGAAETEWPILRDEAIAMATLRAHEGALRPLIPRLSARQKRLLASFGSAPPLSLRAEDFKEPASEVVFSLPVHVQLCCVLPGGVLVVGGVLPRPLSEITALTFVWENLRLNLLEGLVKVNDLAGRAQGAGVDASVDARGGAGRAYLPSGFLFAASLPDGALPTVPDASIQCSYGSGVAGERTLPSVDAFEAAARFAAHLATVDPNARLELCERIDGFLAKSPGDKALVDLLALQMSAAVKDLPAQLDVAGPPFAVQFVVDRAIRVADAGMFFSGWFHADAKAKVQVTCHAEEGEFKLSAHWVRWARPDVEQHLVTMGVAPVEDTGYFCYVPRKGVARPYYFSVSADSGRVWRVRAPEPALEPVQQAIRGVLAAVDPNRRELRRLMDRHVGPAVGALWASHVPSRHRGFVNTFGPKCAEPLVSIVVPLFGRHDFADVQLALFADDPDFQQVDLIYVVDDPSMLQEFRGLCHDLYHMYRVPFTLAYPGDNLGFAGASNYGVAIARAQHLLLLNSDVMPREPGWLSTLLEIYRSRPDSGVLGAKLLYEDGSVQHAGMVSRRNPQWQDMWINHHPHKGMRPASLTGVQDAEAVTAACALVETALYRELGGLSEQYIVGDFEDSDLCHRVRSNGRVNRVALDVSLYHLERQSQAKGGDANWRTALTIYNCWLHNRRWGAVIGGESA